MPPKNSPERTNGETIFLKGKVPQNGSATACTYLELYGFFWRHQAGAVEWVNTAGKTAYAAAKSKKLTKKNGSTSGAMGGSSADSDSDDDSTDGASPLSPEDLAARLRTFWASPATSNNGGNPTKRQEKSVPNAEKLCCTYCQKIALLKECPCKNTRYCGTECQVADW
eukprot:CAMPEP_0171989346 /NCGR_PEP_ID=MMETSP0993-20121228/276367_1 /TAXON_ID=483369 /ORGANISM="non described non described, Strain CCMP2098" /LENGTH=167 /DNA_ID=CAMNT_0012642335 /DNA_START=77 /DNA_END=577 /DNA_ORIENTATION=+